jgi:hypothetical protein
MADASTATREPGTDPAEPQQSFAAREQQRKPYPNPFTHIIDDAAGVTYQTATRDRDGKKAYTAEIIFRDGKPPQHVIDHMKAKGFRWDRNAADPEKEIAGAWSYPRGFKTEGPDKHHANIVAREVIDMMRLHKGLEPAGRFTDAEEQRRDSGQDAGVGF